jgi:RNA polymerase sigma-70 factor (ECF subfamily)
LFFKKSNNRRDEFSLDSLLQLCKAGDETAQRQLYRLYFPYAKSICLRYSSSEMEAEEILDDGFMKIFRKLEQFDTGQSFKAWLRTIMINTSIDFYRRNRKYAETLHLENALEVPFDDRILDNISAQEILELVRQLSPAYRTVFMMYVMDGYNHREIGEILGINEGTSKSNFAKARQKLQEMVKTNHPTLYLNYVKSNHN